MLKVLSTDLSAQFRLNHQLKAWVVFVLCLSCSAVGVVLSFLVLGSTLTGVKQWAAGLVIAIVMLGISYGAKYANPSARETFTPVDLVQYISQGFLWPSTWPALADFLGIQKIAPPPQATTWLNELLMRLANGLG